MSTNPSQSHVGQMFDLRSDASGAPAVHTLISNNELQVTQLKIAAGEKRPPHASSSIVLMYCVAGRVSIYIKDTEFELSPEKLLYLEKNEQHRLKGIEESILLIVNVGGSTGHAQTEVQTARKREEVVQEASEESFPASDAPSWTPVISN